MTTIVLTRDCGHCGGPMEGRGPRAKFCSKNCTDKAWYARHIIRERARIRANYQRNPAISKAATSAWKSAHPEANRAIARRAYAANPETAKQAARARRARERQVEVFIFTDRDWQRIVAQYRGCCAHCGMKTAKLQRDHVIPLARGGRHSVGNIIPACGFCNPSRRDRLIVEWKYKR